MWFKRRKSSEQDHALSESLKSLQSLLSETGRREPNLDAGDAPSGESDAADAPPSGPREPRAMNPRPGDRPGEGRDDGRAGKPEAPGASSNRWRDLTLSFDADPVRPKVRRDDSAGGDDPDRAPESLIEPDDGAGETARSPEPVVDDSDPAAAAESSVRSDDAVAAQAPETPEPDTEPHEPAAETRPTGPDDDPADSEPPEQPDIVTYGAAAPLPPRGDAATHEPTRQEPVLGEPGFGASHRHDAPPPGHAHTAPDYDFRSPPDEQELVLDLEAPQPAPGDTDTPATEPSEPGRGDAARDGTEAAEAPLPEPGVGGEADVPARDDSPLESTLPAAETTEASGPPAVEPDEPAPDVDKPAANDFIETTPGDTNEEDQLRLELDATEAAEADIPVLTNAVYVPDTPPEPPRPADAPQEAHIGRCIDNLRTRLQLMELNALSAEQEQALHDTLAEFLDELHRE